MAISLVKGQKVNLTKESVGLDQVMVGLGWDEAQPEKTGLFSIFSAKPQEIDCDASAFLLTENGLERKEDIVYFGNLKHQSKAIKHMGDNLTGAGAGDDEQIMIELSKVPKTYNRIIIVVTIYQAQKRGQHFGMIRNAFCRVVDTKTNNELCRYNLSDTYEGMTAVVFGEIYRSGNEWKFTALGDGTQDGSISQVAARYQK